MQGHQRVTSILALLERSANALRDWKGLCDECQPRFLGRASSLPSPTSVSLGKVAKGAGPGDLVAAVGLGQAFMEVGLGFQPDAEQVAGI